MAPWTTGQAPRLIHALFHVVAPAKAPPSPDTWPAPKQVSPSDLCVPMGASPPGWAHGHPHTVGTAKRSSSANRDQHTTPFLVALLGQPTTGPARTKDSLSLPSARVGGPVLQAVVQGGWQGPSVPLWMVGPQPRQDAMLPGWSRGEAAGSWGWEERGQALAPHSLQPAQPLAYLFYTLNESNMSSEETILRLKKKTHSFNPKF